MRDEIKLITCERDRNYRLRDEWYAWLVPECAERSSSFPIAFIMLN